ncbi:tRNA adenosine(34) deaminase TadA [Bdellovibrio bacteriovorus]|uniref:tRNA-specific adenosine deaminase n=1 Tax=Bdellovibrio bacteriovorus str. Tiberius TaxID=1069642 RepID=K7YTL1_BDEBC|nr:tRNA adenosine(34) deaminase TadA [Bdellovibrio bacteriovorus]AFX99929.1 cytosine deaminase [Bdellovibrio bacteriovorus str. Tiberius]
MNTPAHDEKWMRKAVALAKKAAERDEVPVAAIVVGPEGMISYAINTRERQQSPLGHAELLALHKASQKRGSWRLSDCTLYVTLEPCVMCAGAIQQSRISRVVYGAKDAKAGAVESLYHILNDSRLNHQVEVSAGILEDDCSELLQGFFKGRRDEKKSEKAQKVFRDRASVVVLHEGKVLGFHAVDPTAQVPYFFLPGGAVEKGETPAATAARECLEETGYKIRILQDSAFERVYNFPWDGKVHACRTVFYVGVLDQKWVPPGKIEDASYHQGVDWVSAKDAAKVFGYNKDILWAVQKLLKTAQKVAARTAKKP